MELGQLLRIRRKKYRQSKAKMEVKFGKGTGKETVMMRHITPFFKR
jgi:hypothetical protein